MALSRTIHMSNQYTLDVQKTENEGKLDTQTCMSNLQENRLQ